MPLELPNELLQLNDPRACEIGQRPLPARGRRTVPGGFRPRPAANAASSVHAHAERAGHITCGDLLSEDAGDVPEGGLFLSIFRYDKSYDNTPHFWPL